jgi:Flp pilus assembly protein TadD
MLLDLAVCVGLVLATFAVYAQSSGFAFVNYDDDVYVSQNAHVRAGITPASVKWSLTAPVAGNWAPVTMLSHLADVELFGMESGMHHLVNVAIHALAATFLFLFLRRATGALYASAFVALVFALHPLHVESVAWISERKDVLSALFWFGGFYAYLRYCERPTEARFLVVSAALCLGLMSKAMMVTFPFTLLLLDVWPLRRGLSAKTITEKLPLILICAGASVVTYMVQKSAGAMVSVPFVSRIENAAVSYVTYMGQMFWPAGLACFYPYPESIPAWQAAAAFAGILAVSALAITARRAYPYLFVGWFWYLGTLIPVIGLVTVGIQAHADRYTYIPMVGLLLILAWGAVDVDRQWPRLRPAIGVLAVICCAACATVAWTQTAYWRNDETLFQHAVDVTQRNWLAENDLGLYLNATGRAADAIPHFETALRIKPDEARVHDSLGVSFIKLGDCAAAIPHFQSALSLRPDSPKANYNLGYCLASRGGDADAVPYFTSAIRSQPDFADAHVRLAMSLSRIPARAPEAVRAYEAALRLVPGDARVHARFGELLANLGRTDEAIAQLETAQRLHPDSAISKMLADVRAARQ